MISILDSLSINKANFEYSINGSNNLYEIFQALGFETLKIGLNSVESFKILPNQNYFSVNLVNPKHIPKRFTNYLNKSKTSDLIDKIFEIRMEFLTHQYFKKGYIDIESEKVENLFIESALSDFNRINVETTPFLIYSIDETNLHNALGTGTTFIARNIRNLPIFEYLNDSQKDIVQFEIDNYFSNRGVADNSSSMEIGSLAGNPNINRKSFTKIAFNHAYAHSQYRLEIVDKIILCSEFGLAEKYALFGAEKLENTRIKNVKKIKSSFIASTLCPEDYSSRRGSELEIDILNLMNRGGDYPISLGNY